uniref:Uncharacterized protein n=1 Tax=Trichogramma kaykai TaxID=54128 RepID=A0ABD2X4E5_9HYME
MHRRVADGAYIIIYTRDRVQYNTYNDSCKIIAQADEREKKISVSEELKEITRRVIAYNRHTHTKQFCTSKDSRRL